MGSARGRRRRRFGAAVVGAGLLAFSLLAGATQASFTVAKLTNSTDTAKAGAMAFRYDYRSTSCSDGLPNPASVQCTDGVTPSAAVPSTGSASGTTGITNTGDIPSSRLSQTFTAASCGPIRMRNINLASDPLLARYDVDFSVTGGPPGGGMVTYGSGTGYGAGVSQQTAGGSYVAPLISISDTTYRYSYALSMKTTSASGRLFGIGSSPGLAGNPTFDRTLTMTSGALRFTAGSQSVNASGTWNDGNWHSVYVLVSARTQVLLLNLVLTRSYTTTMQIFVDGVSRGTVSGSVQLLPATGYYYTGPTFTGSLSQVAVFNNRSAPTSPPSAPFPAATEYWPLDADGTTIHAGDLSWVSTQPCGMVNVEGTFTNPSATIPSTTLSALANGVGRSIPAPDGGQTQTMVLSTSRGAAYDPLIAGLHLFVPITIRHTTSPTSSWTVDATWRDPNSVFIS